MLAAQWGERVWPLQAQEEEDSPSLKPWASWEPGKVWKVLFLPPAREKVEEEGRAGSREGWSPAAGAEPSSPAFGRR